MNPDFDPQPFIDHFTDLSKGTGLFDAVNGSEPEAVPVTGLTSAVWAQRFGPVPADSGLSASSARLVLNQRFYTTTQTDPLDAIDPAMLRAMSTVLGLYHGGFNLVSIYAPGARIDLLGQSGVIMDAEAAYMKQGDMVFRVYDLPIPIILNDLWEQIP